MRLKGKNVLVTGSEGFIGSHLVEALLGKGCNIRAFVFYNSFNSWGWLDTFQKDKLNAIEVFMGDVRDPNGMNVAMKGIDVVFHLAALIGIPFSYCSPDSYIDTNIKGTLNILQSCMAHDVERAIMTSTSEVYGTARYVPMDEGHPLQGQSPYSASKIGADKLAESFCLSFNLPVVIARPFNTYGPRQSSRAVIPTIINQLLSGARHIRLGALHPTRDFVYVKDTVDGLIALTNSVKAIGEVINIATGKEMSIENLAEKLIDNINPGARMVMDKKRLRPKNSEVQRLLGSNAKIRKLTDWRPRYTLEEGLEETIEWFKENSRLYKADVYNI